MRNRKEEILIVALHLFARDGYEAVSVSQIAGALGITKGALYRHFKSKRDIFDCIVQRMEQEDSEQAADNNMPEDNKESMPEKYETISLEDFIQYSKSMFEYWTSCPVSTFLINRVLHLFVSASTFNCSYFFK